MKKRITISFDVDLTDDGAARRYYSITSMQLLTDAQKATALLHVFGQDAKLVARNPRPEPKDSVEPRRTKRVRTGDDIPV